MPHPKNAMEIFQLLDKSNCRRCGEKTCLAFAGAVYRGARPVSDCPILPPEIISRYTDASAAGSIAQNREDNLDILKSELRNLDLAETARRTGGRVSGDRLILKVMGKDFGVDKAGKFYTDIHVNPWVAAPLLSYVLYSKGVPAGENWRSFRELREGAERYPLFAKRCEEAMKRVADVYTDLFDDMVHIFNGRQVAEQFESDISMVLHPLPRVPVMICYWQPEDGLDSTLNVFFDVTANDNLDIGSLFSLGAGMTQMFEKLALRHGAPVTVHSGRPY